MSRSVLPALAVLAAGFCCVAPAAAAGHGVDELGSYGESAERDFASPQAFAFELRFGPYRPSVDEEAALGDNAPYQDMFGSRPRLMGGMEWDWQPLRLPDLLSLGPGLGVAYTRVGADSFVTATGERSGEESGLNVVPSWACAVARLDVLARRTAVPLVGYAKLGVASAWWWVTNGSGTAQHHGVRAKGRSDGLFYAAGLMLELDFMDPHAARAMDYGSGVNHSYLFGEWTVLDLGTSAQMHVGDSTWNLGLAFEF